MSSKTKTIKKAAAGILVAAVVAVGASAQYGGGLMPEMGITAYAADTSVTWDESKLNTNFNGSPISDGESKTIDGVTLTAVKGEADIGLDGFFYLLGSDEANSFQFSTTLGKFTKIEITRNSYMNILEGISWVSGDVDTWTGNADTVTFGTSINGITQIKFTIESTTVPATATYAQVGEDYQPQFDGDTAASLWRVTVKAGSDSIETIDVKLGDIASEEKAQTLETPITTDAEIVLGVVTNLSGEAVNGMGGFTVMVNGEAL